MQTFLCSSSSRAAHRCLRPPPRPASRPGAPRGAAEDSAALCAGPTLPELAPSRRLGPMAEAGRSPAMSPDQPASQEAVAAAELDPEPEAPSPPAPALRWLPGDPSPRGRSQSDLSSASSRGRPLRVHISGSGKGGAGWSGGGPGRASQGQVAVARVAIVPGRPRAAVGGGGLRARAKAAVPTSPPPAGLQKLGVPRLRGQATGGCVQVGAPLCCAGAARLGFRGFPWTPSPLCGARRHPPVLALVLGLIWFLD